MTLLPYFNGQSLIITQRRMLPLDGFSVEFSTLTFYWREVTCQEMHWGEW